MGKLTFRNLLHACTIIKKIIKTPPLNKTKNPKKKLNKQNEVTAKRGQLHTFEMNGNKLPKEDLKVAINHFTPVSEYVIYMASRSSATESQSKKFL